MADVTAEDRERAREVCVNHYTGPHGGCQSCHGIARALSLARQEGAAAERERCVKIASNAGASLYDGMTIKDAARAARNAILEALRRGEEGTSHG